MVAEKRGAKVEKKLEIHPLHADTVRLAFRLALEGNGTSVRMGVKAIAKHLNERKLYTAGEHSVGEGGPGDHGRLAALLCRKRPTPHPRAAGLPSPPPARAGAAGRGGGRRDPDHGIEDNAAPDACRSGRRSSVGGWSAQFCTEVADGVGFEPTVERDPTPVFKTGALNRSATHP